jgi:hypothetical protein
VLVLVLWLLVWDCSVVYQLHLAVATFFQFIVRISTVKNRGV